MSGLRSEHFQRVKVEAPAGAPYASPPQVPSPMQSLLDDLGRKDVEIRRLRERIRELEQQSDSASGMIQHLAATVADLQGRLETATAFIATVATPSQVHAASSSSSSSSSSAAAAARVAVPVLAHAVPAVHVPQPAFVPEPAQAAASHALEAVPYRNWPEGMYDMVDAVIEKPDFKSRKSKDGQGKYLLPDEINLIAARFNKTYRAVVPVVNAYLVDKGARKAPKPRPKKPAAGAAPVLAVPSMEEEEDDETDEADAEYVRYMSKDNPEFSPIIQPADNTPLAAVVAAYNNMSRYRANDIEGIWEKMMMIHKTSDRLKQAVNWWDFHKIKEDPRFVRSDVIDTVASQLQYAIDHGGPQSQDPIPRYGPLTAVLAKLKQVPRHTLE